LSKIYVSRLTMSATNLNATLEELLRQSLRAWRVTGDVTHATDGALLVAAGERCLRISRAPAGVPFRWMVTEGERTRGVLSIAGLLRTLRAAVDPGYRSVRLRIAPLPVVPS
jgi:hypothetical protein